MWCDEDKHQIKGPLYSWYYIFYLSKYYEFIDTYILILRKVSILSETKYLIFLETYHFPPLFPSLHYCLALLVRYL